MRKFLVLACVLCTASIAEAQSGICDPEDDCAGPRNWFTDYTNDPVVESPADWQDRGLPVPFVNVEGLEGLGVIDGSASFQLVDTDEHWFEGHTISRFIMNTHPDLGPGIPDDGIAYWINFDNEGKDGGTYGFYTGLRRDDFGEPEVYFAGEDGQLDPASGTISVPEGPVDFLITTEARTDGSGRADVTYSLIDSGETEHTGAFNIGANFGGDGGFIPEKWGTIFGFSFGAGTIDMIAICNQGTGPGCSRGPVDPMPPAGDFNADGIVDGEDLNLALFGWDQDGATLPSEWVHMRPADGVAVGVEELNKVLFTWAETFPSTASVPEPATIALGAISLLMLVASQTRRRRT